MPNATYKISPRDLNVWGHGCQTASRSNNNKGTQERWLRGLGVVGKLQQMGGRAALRGGRELKSKLVGHCFVSVPKEITITPVSTWHYLKMTYEKQFLLKMSAFIP